MELMLGDNEAPKRQVFCKQFKLLSLQCHSHRHFLTHSLQILTF